MDEEDDMDFDLGVEVHVEEQTLDSALQESDEEDPVIAALVSAETSGAAKSTPTKRPTSSASASKSPTSGRSTVKALRGLLLTKLSEFMNKDNTRREVGMPTAMAVQSFLALGTSRGVVLLFDPKQVWKATLAAPAHAHYGAVTALAMSPDGTRLLAGHQGGQIVRWDVLTGKVCNTMTDIFPQNSAVLRLSFFDWRRYALANDATGSLFLLTFKKVVGMRTSDKHCLISGGSSEVCGMAVLHYYDRPIPRDMGAAAIATRDKVMVVFTRPELSVGVRINRKEGDGDMLPSMAWQFVPIEIRGRVQMEPVLAFTWGNTIRFLQMNVSTDERMGARFAALGSLRLRAPVIVLRWLNESTLLAVDNMERARVVDVRSKAVVELADLSAIQLHASIKFHQMQAAMGMEGPVVRDYEASVGTVGGITYLLGVNGVSALSLFNWMDRLAFLKNENKFVEALALARDFYHGRAVATTGIPVDPSQRQRAVRELLLDMLQAYADISICTRTCTPETANEDQAYFAKVAALCIDYCLEMDSKELLFGDLHDRFSSSPAAHAAFLEALLPLVLSERLLALSPVVMKALVEYLESSGQLQSLAEVLVRVEAGSLDLHHAVGICWSHGLYDALLRLHAQGLGDYVTPLAQLTTLLRNAIQNRMKDGKSGNVAPRMSVDEQSLGYKILLCVSSSLTGHAFPSGRGRIPPQDVRRVQWEVYRFLLTERGERDPSDTYPNIRTLLLFDTREFLNVLSLAFDEVDEDDAGEGPRLPTRQKVVDTLLAVMVLDTQAPPGKGKDMFSPEQVGSLFTFLARQMARHTRAVVVERRLFELVLDYLAETGHPSQHGEREQALLDLLHAGGIVQFDPSRLVRLAERAEFWNVCELVHRRAGDYVAVTYCYLRDATRRTQVFEFLRAFLTNESSSPADLRKIEDVVRRELRTLVGIDPKATGRLLLQVMRRELRALAAILEDSPDVQYALLSGLFAARPTMDDADLIEIPPELQELYLSHMCQRQPRDVYGYLRQTTDYRLAECLEIVRHHRVTDATAWLLERNGDYIGAFTLIKNSLDERIRRMTESFLKFEAAARLKQQAADARPQAISDLRHMLGAALQMCLRSSQRLNEADRKSMWFPLLDTLIACQRKTSAELAITGAYFAKIMQELTKSVVNSMMGYVPLPAVLRKIVQETSLHGFGEIKELILSMMEMYNYEHLLLDTTTNIVRTDLLRSLRTRRGIQHKGFHLRTKRCGICHLSVLGQQASATAVFHCGHAFHGACMETVMPRESTFCFLCMQTSQHDTKPSKGQVSLWDVMEVEGKEAATTAPTVHNHNALVPPSRPLVLLLDQLSQSGRLQSTTAGGFGADALALHTSGRQAWMTERVDRQAGVLEAQPRHVGEAEPGWMYA